LVDIQRTITSNNTKLLKHLDKLQDIQRGNPVSPVMIHLALTNSCNLDCDYCCYGGRDKGESLTLEQAISVIDQFSKLGTKGLEITGGGDPLLHKDVNTIVKYGKDKGMSIGLITNGLAYKRFNQWDKLDWIRLSSHALNYNEKVSTHFLNALLKAKNTDNLNVGSVHIFTGDYINYDRVVKIMEKYKTYTRITPDLTKSPEWIQKNMPMIAEDLKNRGAKYSFVSDFNITFDRPNNNCYLKLVKPYIHPNGIVYQCPGASFSPENFCNVDDKYKVCSIEDITKTYSQPSNLKPIEFDCKFCKYQQQNNLIDDILKETKDNDFA